MSRRIRRAVTLRLGAILLGLTPLLVCEAALRLWGWGPPVGSGDPYVGFASVQPLFHRNEAGDRYEIAPARQSHFRPDGFDAHKDPREFRIFCLGGSTVQGEPYSIETAFPAWLELSLRAADPDRRWRVVNCGGLSYASYRLVPILEETLRYEPDLYIIYTGHNEFLEARTYGDARRRAETWWGRAAAFVLQSRTGALVYELIRRPGRGATATVNDDSLAAESSSDERPDSPGELHASPGEHPRSSVAEQSAPPLARSILPTEVDALLDYQGGLEPYHHDDDWRAAVVEHYEFNLRRMVESARRAGVPVLLVDPVANVRDTPPFKIEHDPALSQPDRDEFDRRWREAFGEPDASAPEHDASRSLDELASLRDIDPRHAGVRFALGKSLEAARRFTEARDELAAALNEDVCPLRMIEPLHAALARVADETQTPLVPVRQAFADRSHDGLVGDQWLVDHVHPTVAGHQLIAELLLAEMERQSMVQTKPNAASRRDLLFDEHLASLDPAYFERGKQRLAGLLLWTQGRAKKLRPDVPPSARPDRTR